MPATRVKIKRKHPECGRHLFFNYTFNTVSCRNCNVIVSKDVDWKDLNIKKWGGTSER